MRCRRWSSPGGYSTTRPQGHDTTMHCKTVLGTYGFADGRAASVPSSSDKSFVGTPRFREMFRKMLLARSKGMGARYRSTIDPMMDGAAARVVAAFEAAQRARLAPVECYRAGVEAWRRAHPDQARTYAA